MDVNRDGITSNSYFALFPENICGLETDKTPENVENKDKLTTDQTVSEEKVEAHVDQAKDGCIKLNQTYQEEIDKLQKLLTEEIREVRIKIN